MNRMRGLHTIFRHMHISADFDACWLFPSVMYSMFTFGLKWFICDLDVTGHSETAYGFSAPRFTALDTILNDQDAHGMDGMSATCLSLHGQQVIQGSSNHLQPTIFQWIMATRGGTWSSYLCTLASFPRLPRQVAQGAPVGCWTLLVRKLRGEALGARPAMTPMTTGPAAYLLDLRGWRQADMGLSIHGDPQ